ncbi:hypothetical protein [Tepidiforma sp.]|uniref:hypothetical protein n=1 Tax=Tepidiforma sp. TaxID=2682230 RepID=UPI002618D374|nr:hypothetical protein [Tepidiforma sp.]MCX7618926.1 hypothetical protein [Tepidiforma sp.]
MNIYARLDQLRRAVNLGSSHAGEDARLLDIAEQVSRAIDDYIGYPAYELAGVAYAALERYCEANGWGTHAYLARPLVSVTSIEVDEDRDGVYELSLTPADYVLEPDGADAIGRPYWKIRLQPWGALGRIPAFPRALRITGVHGWPFRRIETGRTVTCAAAGTALTASGPLTDLVHPGDIVMLDDERMYVEAVAGSAFTVRRGVNGSAAAAHAGAELKVLEPPAALARAMLAWMGRMSWDELGGWQGSVMLTDAGGGAGYGSRSTTTWSAVRALLAPYRRVAVA